MYADIVSEVTLESSDSTYSRPLTTFHPPIWGDYFHASNVLIIDSTKKQEHNELKEKVRRMLREADGDLQILELINAVQRLGVSYHFETEIDDALQKLHQQTTINSDDDLYAVALRFRLLRQQGYAVSCDIFNKFKDDEGNFKEILSTDIRGMLSLYEATYLSVHADEIFEKALTFTTYHLKEFSMVKDDLLAKQVIHALNRPLHQGMPRAETRHFISVYQDEVCRNETLLKFAKLDFNLVQAQHREELVPITKWWKDVDIPTNLPYARDRIVEVYVWVIGVYFEPCYNNARRTLTIMICIISLMDDTYDAFATFEENELFTTIVDSGEVGRMNELPKNMQFLYGLIIKLYDQVDQDSTKEGRPYCVNYVKDACKELAKCYFREVKWCHDGHIPTVEEYDIIGGVTSTYALILTTAIVGLGDAATKEALDWFSAKPKILTAASYVGRVMNDIVSHQFESERGHHVASAVQCYMKQYGVTEEEAVVVLRKRVRDAWKDINEEFLEHPKGIHVSLLRTVLNLTRITDVMYKDGDGYTRTCFIKEAITSILIHPILL